MNLVDASNQEELLIETKSLVREMQKIRIDSLASSSISQDNESKYRIMVSRLSDNLKAILGQGFGRLDKFSKKVIKNHRLTVYDPLQREYWLNENRKFVEDLDTITTSVFGNSFNNLEYEHHFLQAMKFSASASLQGSDKSNILNTINPFNGPSPEEDSPFKKLLIGLEQFKMEKTGMMKSKFNGNLESIPQILDEIRKMGFISAKTQIFEGDFLKIRNQIKFPYQVTIETNQPQERRRTGLEEALRIGLARTVQYTAPVSYPILGTIFSNKLLRRIKKNLKIETPNQGADLDDLQNYRERFNRDYNLNLRYVANSGFTFRGISGAGLFTAGLIAAFSGPFNWVPLVTLGATGLYLGIESIVNAGNSNGNEETRPRATLPFKLLFLPVENVLDKKDQEKTKRGRLTSVEFKLQGNKKETVDQKDYFKYFSEISEFKTSATMEEKIGDAPKEGQSTNEFTNFLSSQFNLTLKPIYSQGFLYYASEQKSEGMVQQTFLVCSKDKRYVISRSGRKKIKMDPVSLVKDLTSDPKVSPYDQAKKKINAFRRNSDYVRFSYYESADRKLDLVGRAD
jgi:hypothetical protein